MGDGRQAVHVTGWTSGLTAAAVMLTLFAALLLVCGVRNASAAPAPRVVPKPYLLMPHTADGKIPALLSQTGVFKDTRNLVPSDGLIPYDLVVSFWSDGASKQRWVSLP